MTARVVKRKLEPSRPLPPGWVLVGKARHQTHCSVQIIHESILEGPAPLTPDMLGRAGWVRGVGRSFDLATSDAIARALTHPPVLQ